MGITKKKNFYKRSSKKKVEIITTKPPHWTDAQWERFNSDEVLFPKKLAKANEMLAKTKFMDEKQWVRINKQS